MRLGAGTPASERQRALCSPASSRHVAVGKTGGLGSVVTKRNQESSANGERTTRPPSYFRAFARQADTIPRFCAPASRRSLAQHLGFSADEGVYLKWGAYTDDPVGALSEFDGAANPSTLVAQPRDSPAAQWAHEYEIGRRA